MLQQQSNFSRSSALNPACSRVLRGYLVLALAVALQACGFFSSEPDPTPGIRRVPSSGSSYSDGDQRLSWPEPSAEPQAESHAVPWDIFPLRADLRGATITVPDVLRGDEYLAAGMRERALQYYLGVKQVPPQSSLEEALALRIASAQLGLNQPAKALGTLSDYCRRTNKSIEEVGPHFSLIFAYAYGAANDIEQSLAWFSRTNRLVAGQGGIAQAADSGARLLLRSLSEYQINGLSSSWSTDSFVAGMLGQERRRRLGQQYVAQFDARGKHFWEMDTTEAVKLADAVPGSPTVVGLILPLTGKFGELGNQIKRGVELALSGQGAENLVRIVTREEGGDAIRAAAEARNLVTNDRAQVIIGPLLADSSTAVSDIVRQSGVLQLSFSKQDSFVTGGGIFRLGPTAASQVDSLVEVVSRQQQLQKFGLVYPDDEQGREFAELFRRKLAGTGLQLVFESSYAKDDPQAFLAIGDQLSTIDIHAVFLPDSLRAAAAFRSGLSTDLRKKIELIGPASWDDPMQLEQSRSVLENIVFVSPFFAKSRRPIISEFIATYKSRYKQTPTFLAAQGFDAATMLFAAIRRQADDQIDLGDAFRGISVYDGLTGTVTVENEGELARTFSVVRFGRDGVVDLIEEGSTVAPAPSFVFHGNMPVQTDGAAQVPGAAQKTLGSAAAAG